MRIIRIVMQTAAFVAEHRRINNQFGYRGDVAQFDQITCNVEVPVVFFDFLLNVPDTGFGTLQAFVRAHDSHVIPHETADLVPVVGDDDLLVGVPRVAGRPLRNRMARADGTETLQIFRDMLRGAVSPTTYRPLIPEKP